MKFASLLSASSPVQSRTRRPALALSILLVFAASCRPATRHVTVCHAGSLGRFIQEAADLYQSDHPGLRIFSESSGSLDAVRKVTELGKPCDLVAVADERLIRRFLIPGHADVGYRFLGNDIVLAAASDDFFERNGGIDLWRREWADLLFRASSNETGRAYSYGISDPDRDPAGYYSHMVWKLSEVYYDRAGLYRRFLSHLDPRNIRPKSSELIALLQTGHLDLAFLYRSTALQSGLAFVALPDEVSLGDENWADFYARVFFDVQGARPGELIKLDGHPVRYGVSRMRHSRPASQGFLDFLLSPEMAETARRLGYRVLPSQPITKAVGPS